MAGEGSAATSSLSEEELTLTVKWSGKEYTVRVCGDDSVGELKRRICQLTNVLPKRQKLLYPKLLASKLADDSVLLSHLPFKSSLKMTMIGFFLFLSSSFLTTYAHQVFDNLLELVFLSFFFFSLNCALLLLFPFFFFLNDYARRVFDSWISISCLLRFARQLLDKLLELPVFWNYCFVMWSRLNWIFAELWKMK